MLSFANVTLFSTNYNKTKRVPFYSYNEILKNHLPMEKNGTLLKRNSKNQHSKPGKHIIDNILNYSKNIEVFSTRIGYLIVVNN